MKVIHREIGVWVWVGSLMISFVSAAEPLAQSQPSYHAKRVAQITTAKPTHP